MQRECRWGQLSAAGLDCTYLRPDQSLEAGLEEVNAAVVEPGHLLQELLVLGLKVLSHRPQLLTGLERERTTD